MVEFVIFNLLCPSAVGLANGLLHRLGYCVCVHYHKSVDISGRAARRLGQGSPGAQEAFFVGVKDRHKRHCRNIQPLAKEVDTDQHVEESVLEVLDDLDPLSRVHIGMDVAHTDVDLVQIVGQFLGHSLGQGRDENPLIFLCPLAYLLNKVIHLILGRSDFNRRIQQTGRPHNLLYHKAVGAF